MSRQEDRFSVVIPFHNEEENVDFVLREVRDLLPEAEIIAVDDGSHDHTWECINRHPSVRGLRFQENRGQSAAIYYGLMRATGDVCGLMDGDGQNDPADFPHLLEILKTQSADVVCGVRKGRQDRWQRRLASRIANAIRRGLLRDAVSDTGCSVKVFHSRAIAVLVPFNGLHRFLPALFKHAGFKICEVAVNHRPRRAGASNYTIGGRAIRGMFDLIGMIWLLRRGIAPVETLEKDGHRYL